MARPEKNEASHWVILSRASEDGSGQALRIEESKTRCIGL